MRLKENACAMYFSRYLAESYRVQYSSTLGEYSFSQIGLELHWLSLGG
jgi:hypothetical protein